MDTDLTKKRHTELFLAKFDYLRACEDGIYFPLTDESFMRLQAELQAHMSQGDKWDIVKGLTS